MSDRTCATCLWVTGLIQLECRRFPPQMVLFPTDNQHPIVYEPYPAFPSVKASEWCGEWSDRVVSRDNAAEGQQS